MPPADGRGVAWGGRDKGRGSLSALSNSNPAVECSSCFCQVQPAAVPSLHSSPLSLLLWTSFPPRHFFSCFLSLLHLPLPELFISSPFRVVYAVVSACCFHVCFFARVSFTALPPLSLSVPSVSLLLLLVTSSCASYSRQVCFICITNQSRASENLRKATYFTFLYHLPPSISFPSSSCLLTLLSFTLYPPAFLNTCKPRISLTVLRDCLRAALTLPASSFRIRIQKSSLQAFSPSLPFAHPFLFPTLQ